MTGPDAAEEPAAEVSFLGRLIHTPLRDAVRGRVTGRLDVSRLVEAHLPDRAGAVVRDVVRRTRLWRLERAEVAEELVAHFSDGIDAGMAEDALIEQFGDPVRAARLIRRARRRARPWPWHAVRYAVRTVCVIILVYVAVGVHFLLGRPAPSVDFRPMFNTVADAVPAGERAWPLYREALLGLPRLPVNDRNELPRAGDDRWPEFAAYLDAHQRSIDLARRGAAMPGLGLRVGYGVDEADRVLWPDVQPHPEEQASSLLHMMLPHLAELRRLSRLLALDAHRAADAGDGETALTDLVAMLGLARQTRETPVFIADLVSIAIARQAVRTAGGLLADRPELWTDDQLRELAHRFASCDDLLHARLDGERLMLEDLIQRLYTDDGRGSGRITREGLVLLDSFAPVLDPDYRTETPLLEMLAIPAASLVMQSRREASNESRRLLDAIERAEGSRPLWEMDVSWADREMERWQETVWSTLRHVPMVLLIPALGKGPITGEQTAMERNALLVGVGLELYRRRTGSWPPDLETLVPRLLPQVPVDRFDGRPLRYAIIDGVPVVYSVGTDRDDDGGSVPDGPLGILRPDAAIEWIAPSRLPDRTERGLVPDGDWRLWPAVRRPVIR